MWLVLGVVLLAVELRHFAFYALFGAIGAFAAALIAALVPSAVWLQVLVAVAAATVGIIAFRPMMSKAFHRHQEEAQIGRGVHGALVGEEVLTLDVVGGTHAPGHVRLAGERWLAVSGSEQRIPAGTPVLVTAVEGTKLIVWPVEGAAGYVDHHNLDALDAAPEDPEGDQR